MSSVFRENIENGVNGYFYAVCNVCIQGKMVVMSDILSVVIFGLMAGMS